MPNIPTTAGQALINAILPEDMRDYQRTLDKKGLAKLLSEVASKHPEKYRDISFRLGALGRMSAYRTGGFSFGLQHARRTVSGNARRQKLTAEIDRLLDDDNIDDKTRDTEILRLTSELMSKQPEEIYQESLAEGNPLAYQLAGAGRGNKMNLAALRGSDGLYQDHRNNVIPVPVLRSYSQGLSPLEYWAGTYGARQGVIAVKFCLAAGTQVLLPDGSTKAIEDIRVGDAVMTLGAAKQIVPTRVTATFDNGLRPCREFFFRRQTDNQLISVTATDVHNVLARTVDADLMLPLSLVGILKLRVVDAFGDTASWYVRAKTVADMPTYDIEVEHESHRFVLANGIVASNSTRNAGYLCLAAGTKVMRPGSPATAIEQLCVGDKVIGASEAGFMRTVAVTAVFDKGAQPVYSYRFANDAGTYELTIIATPQHRVLARIGEGNNQQLPLGDASDTFELAVAYRAPDLYLRFKSATFLGLQPTYDIEVDHPDHLFVLANGAIVSNSKQLNQIAHRALVVADDDDKEPDTIQGLPVDVNDDDSEGSLLAAPVGDYKRNTVLTPKILRDLREKGVKRLLVRSPAISGTADGGLYARDVGVREFGRLPTRGENVGLAAAQALCLAGDTFVRLANGTAKPIRDIAVGDVVVGCSKTGVTRPTTVLAKYENGKRTCYRFAFRAADGEQLELISTAEHKILTAIPPSAESVIAAVGSSAGEALYAKLATGEAAELCVQTFVGDIDTFDITVDHPDHLFVLENNLVVSNSEPISQSQLCLAADTLVRMADGSTKPIADIAVGDVVLGGSLAGVTAPATVRAVYDNGLRDCIETCFDSTADDDVVLRSTADHQLLVVSVDTGESFIMRAGVAAACTLAGIGAVEAVRHIAGTETGLCAYKGSRIVGSLSTFDISVDNEDHLFVLANGLIVSNSAKHTGGVAGQTKAVSGFDFINQLVQVPKTFKDGAAHATVDGIVQHIEPAPAGGSYVTIDGTKHYVGAGFELRVKKGDRIEAGDVLSEGTPNPALVVKYKGIGEGRRYFTEAFRKAIKEAGMNANRRNIELIARGLINHVRLTDEVGDFAPDDVVQYNTLAARYQPREGFKAVAPAGAVGKYLEKPYLHYSIGTRVRPSMLPTFNEFGVKELAVHDDPPPFEPEMIRGMANLQHDPDWMTRMFGSGLKGSLLSGAQRGATSDERGTSFVPSRARAVDFGRTGGAVRPPDPPTGEFDVLADE